jgi:SMC interacting uncharacterized protein involved in chromosome segregation
MKRYAVTNHAIERAAERLGVDKLQACNHLNQLMQTAYLNGLTPSTKGGRTRVFDHFGAKVRIIVAAEEDRIITVYKFPEVETVQAIPTAFAADIQKTIQRKYSAAERDYKRQTRLLETELAEMNLEIAKLQLNKARAKSPRTISSIEKKVAAIQPKLDVIANELNDVSEKFSRIKEEVGAYL